MAIKKVEALPTACGISISWMVLSMLGAVLTGFFGIAYFADNPLNNPEEVFLELSQVLFNPWIAGILLAALLSAIMSTIDSQFLVASSSMTEDLYRVFIRKNASQTELVWIGRIAVLVIALIALMLATDPKNTVMELVGYAWAGLGCSFGPVIIFSLFWSRTTRHGAVAGMLVGAITVVVWERLTVFEMIPFYLYEMVPAFILSSLAIVGISLLDKTPPSQSVHEFA